MQLAARKLVKEMSFAFSSVCGEAHGHPYLLRREFCRICPAPVEVLSFSLLCLLVNSVIVVVTLMGCHGCKGRVVLLAAVDSPMVDFEYLNRDFELDSS